MKIKVGLVFILSLIALLLTPLDVYAIPNVGDVGAWQTSPNHLSPGNFAPGVADLASVEYNGYAYSLGGYDSNLPVSTVEYTKLNADGTIGTWQATTPMPDNLTANTAVQYNGYIYEMGGTDTTSIVNKVYYVKINSDGSLGAWQNASNLPDTIYDATSVVYNGYVYEIGGKDTNVSGTTNVFYAKINSDGSLGAWQTQASLPTSIFLQSAVLNNGYIYSFGGYITGNYSNAVYYTKINSDGSLGAWQTGTSLPNNFALSSAVTINGYAYVLGGNHAISAGNMLNSVYYAKLNSDGSVGTWQSSSNVIPQLIEGATAVTYDGYIYILDGLISLGGNSVDNSNVVYYTQPNFPATTTVIGNAINGASVVVTTPFDTVQTCASGVGEASLAKQDSSYSYPLGLVSFCYLTANTANQINLIFITSLSPSQVVARDYKSSTQTYSTIPGAVIASTTYNGQAALQLTYSVIDNGILDDNSTMGVVVDPVGLAELPSAPNTGYGTNTKTNYMTKLTTIISLILLSLGSVFLRQYTIRQHS